MSERFHLKLPPDLAEGLSTRARLTYEAMLHNASAEEGFRCWETIPTLAQRAMLSEKTVDRALPELEEAGFLTKGKRNLHPFDRVNSYTLHVYREGKVWADDRGGFREGQIDPIDRDSLTLREGQIDPIERVILSLSERVNLTPSMTSRELAEEGLAEELAEERLDPPSAPQGGNVADAGDAFDAEVFELWATTTTTTTAFISLLSHSQGASWRDLREALG